MERQARKFASPMERVRQLEDQLVSVRRKLLSVPEMDRHYAYRMRVNVDEMVDAISSVLVRGWQYW
jgi:hypothetical protein